MHESNIPSDVGHPGGNDAQMDAIWPDHLPTWTVAALGALAGLILKSCAEFLQDLRAQHFRWDELAFHAFSDFGSSARTARDEAARYSRAVRKGDDEHAALEARREFDSAHTEVRRHFDRIALIGSPTVLAHARSVVKGIYALREQAAAGLEPHVGDWKSTHSKLMSDQASFYRAAREQLRLPSGADLGAALDPTD